MNKHMTLTFAVAAYLMSLGAQAEMAYDSVATGDAQLLGRAGLSADTCIQARAYSDWARQEMYPECVKAFKTHGDDNVGWKGEYWGKTMLCYAEAIAYTHDPSLRYWVLNEVHTFLKENMKPNGYLSTYSDEDFLRQKPQSENALEHWCFNIWGQKYTLWALVDLAKVTGDKEALEGAVKMADHLIAQLKRLNLTLERTGAWNGISSLSILRPVLELNRLAPKKEYRELADQIVKAMEEGKDNPCRLLRDGARKEPIHTWYPQACFWAKAYEIQSCLEGVVDYTRMTGATKPLDEVLTFYGHLEREERNAMGGAGLWDHFVGGASTYNSMTELCDVTHWIRLNRELFLATGEAKYADRIEEAFYNAFLAGVSRDGRWGAHGVRSHGVSHLWAPPQTGMFYHQCCPDNMMRTYFDVADTVAAEAKDGTIAVALYGDAKVKLPRGEVTISGGYPYGDNEVVVNVTRKEGGKVRLRMPEWSKTMVVNGKEVEGVKGWYEVVAPAGTSAWTIGFDFSPRVIPCAIKGHRDLPAVYQMNGLDDIAGYTAYFFTWYTPGNVSLMRTEPAVRVARGPLYLAKGRLAGTTFGETFKMVSVENGMEGWKARLEPLALTPVNAGVPRAWRLSLERGYEKAEMPVSDFASLSNMDDPDNWFSIWF